MKCGDQIVRKTNLGWPQARRFCVARRFIADDSTDTLFSLGRHVYRVWVTNMNLTPERRILELREDFALRKIPTKSVSTNALYLEINAGTWNGTPELLDTCFANVPPDVREIRLRGDSGFGFDPVLQALEKESVDYVVVARMTKGLKRLLPGLRYEPVNPQWEMAEFQYCPPARSSASQK